MVVQLVPMLDRRIDTEVGGYRIVAPLGRGATSVVYRAEHVRLGRAAALKLLAPALGEDDFRERFLRESRLAASLDHPNIVPVFDAGEQDGLLYIAMACVEGSDLKALLMQEGRLPLRRVLRIVGQIASALDAAHARGLVHRDVKPGNILVGPGDRALLSDFGVVKERAAAAEKRVHPRRLLVSIALLCAAAAVGAAAALGVAALVRSDPAPKIVTVVAQPRPSPSPVALDTLVLKSVDGRTLNDAAYYL